MQMIPSKIRTLNHDRGKLIMACGTGKTFTFLKILIKFAEMKRAVAFSNTIAASKDFVRDFPKAESIIICRTGHIDGTLSARVRSSKLQ